MVANGEFRNNSLCKSNDYYNLYSSRNQFSRMQKYINTKCKRGNLQCGRGT